MSGRIGRPRGGTLPARTSWSTASSNIVWGQRGNFLSIPTDCPQRDERLGWLADAQIFARTATASTRRRRLLHQVADDVADAQSPEGAFPDVAPRMIDLADGAPAWGDGGVILPWMLLPRSTATRRLPRERHGGDGRLGRLPPRGQTPNLLWQNNRNNDFGDWLTSGPTPRRSCSAPPTSPTTARTAGAEIARVLRPRRRRGGASTTSSRRIQGRRSSSPTSDRRTAGSRARRRPATSWPWHLTCCRTICDQAALAAAPGRYRGAGRRLTTGFIGLPGPPADPDARSAHRRRLPAAAATEASRAGAT